MFMLDVTIINIPRGIKGGVQHYCAKAKVRIITGFFKCLRVAEIS